MNYTEITTLAAGYADRKDIDLTLADSFLRVVESRVNKNLKTQKMGSKTSIPIVDLQRVYALPVDFAGIRDLKTVDGSRERTMHLVTPEYITTLADSPLNPSTDITTQSPYYAIIADNLEIYPPQKDTGTIEMVYYKKVPELTSLVPNNWLSDINPECYTFGLTAEISMWAKDYEAATAWDGRFTNSLNEIELDDIDTRWSGAPMVVRTV